MSIKDDNGTSEFHGSEVLAIAKAAITDASQVVESLAKQADQQGALYALTDRLFRAELADDIYNAALDAIICALGCERASILLFDEAGTMKFVAWRGLSSEYRRAVEGHSPWTPEAKDPQPICVSNVAVADLEPALKTTVAAEDIAALTFMPLVAKNRIIGKFMTYYRKTHVFSGDEIDLAVTIARQLGFGLQRLRAEEDRRRSEQAHELLLKESRHRIKNTLATVQALASQTLRHTPFDEREAFLSRLQALGEAHDLLNIGDWDQVLLRQVIKRALKPFADRHAPRIVANGPDLWLPSQASLLLTMCLHELATNAAKYGALSNGTGTVQIAWQSAKECKLKLYWRETGGPPVTPPETKGFGSILIDQSFGEDGESCFVFPPEGLICALTISV